MLAGTGVWKISSVANGFSSIKIDYSDYPKRLISKINELCFLIKISLYSGNLLKKQQHKLHLSRLFCCNHTCIGVNICSVTSASCYIMSVSCYMTLASRYHLRYQSRSSMYICGLIPQNFAELAEAVPIDMKYE